jgi:LytR cell envelope-related transcriptional attenuator
VTRRLALLLVVAMAAAASAGVLLATRASAPSTAREPASGVPGLSLLVVRTDAGPLAALAGSTGFGRAGALVLPSEAVLTIPGQGEGTVGEALGLPGRQAATAVGNLLGTWVEHHATIDDGDLVAPADELGGVELGGELRTSRDLRSMLEEPAPGATGGLQVVLEALLAARVRWDATELSDADRAGAVVDALRAAAGSSVVQLQLEELADGVFRPSAEQVTQALVDAFGGPAEEAVPVIVLNGNGVPGIGERVAERILPGGFRIAVSDNASSFDHDETLVVVGSADDVGLGQRVRDLLGVGSVSVSVGSGIAPVTVVVGRDFTG